MCVRVYVRVFVIQFLIFAAAIQNQCVQTHLRMAALACKTRTHKRINERRNDQSKIKEEQGPNKNLTNITNVVVLLLTISCSEMITCS